jgi:maltooligosyltrehalose trehalohydrolase
MAIGGARRVPFGAVPHEDGSGTTFTLWAPKFQAVTIEIVRRGGGVTRAIQEPMSAHPGGGGLFSYTSLDARPGDRYWFRGAGESQWVSDPASRFQPDGVLARSEIVDSASIAGPAKTGWRGRPWHEAVLYEAHVGTFTPSGTYDEMRRKLDHLAGLGITALELMPLQASFGDRGWSYDTTHLYAPTERHGRPEDLARLIREAHARGIMVGLDVVYNHTGARGNALWHWAGPPFFFDPARRTPWGPALNFAASSPHSRYVRDFVVGSALYWLAEFDFDFLRLDAVHEMGGDPAPHVVEAISAAVAEHFPGRDKHLVVECDPAASALRWMRPGAGGRSVIQGVWADEAHHAARVLATRETSGYYGAYAEQTVEKLGRALTQGGADGAPLAGFVVFCGNHDQYGNHARGKRLRYLAPARAADALVLIVTCAPVTPLLFQGDEFAASAPFPYFTDLDGDDAERVRKGRLAELRRRGFAGRGRRGAAEIPDPSARETFRSAQLDWSELGNDENARVLELHRTALAVRKHEIAPYLDGVVAGRAHRFECAGTAGLFCEWTLGGGRRIRLAANLGAEPSGIAAPAGRLILANQGSVTEPGARLGAWDVVLTVHEPTS